MRAPPKIIFFDLDETLIVNQSSAEKIIDAIYDEIIIRHSDQDQNEYRAPFKESLRNLAGKHWLTMFNHPPNHNAIQAWFESALRDIALDTTVDATKALAAANTFLSLAAEHTALSDNALTTLSAIQDKGVQTGIITNGFAQLQTKKINRHALDQIVNVAVVSQQAGAHKPNEQVFNYALRKADLAPAEAWHVGDHVVNDVGGARDAGMTAVLYDPEQKHSPESLQEAGVCPHHTIKNLQEVLGLF